MYPPLNFSSWFFKNAFSHVKTRERKDLIEGRLKWKETDVVLIIAANASPKNFAKTWTCLPPWAVERFVWVSGVEAWASWASRQVHLWACVSPLLPTAGPSSRTASVHVKMILISRDKPNWNKLNGGRTDFQPAGLRTTGTRDGNTARTLHLSASHLGFQLYKCN